ncbi:MAG TPA: hypothetical protein VHR66_16445 [Gemmataceae bacterium]|jgi:hypothetical protein|nr:hypothetical protein [Gemmataceae bacterium]
MVVLNSSSNSARAICTSGRTAGRTARDNFENILSTKTICALGVHCLHGDRIRALPEKKQKQFRVACFTETPLDQLGTLLDVGFRKFQLEPYGFVFQRDYLCQKGAQPAIYINDYVPNRSRGAADCLFEIGVKNGFSGRTWPLLPLVNVMHDGYDFTWEREWRVIGDVDFQFDDLAAVILPEDEYDLRDRMTRIGVPAIDPKWGYEKLVLEMASQQRSAKKAWKSAAVAKR